MPVINSFTVSRATRMVALGLLFVVATTAVYAQKADPQDPQNSQRGVELLKQAIAARGGEAYLKFKTLTATGLFTPFDKGSSTVPVQFLDIIVYPDKERTEFGKGKKKDRRIQVNVGQTGWVYDGDAETLKDQTDKQIQAHVADLALSLDSILRGGWQQPGAQVRFYGREEIRPGERADVVAVQLKPEQTVYLWLDRYTHLPMSLSYEKIGAGGLEKHEVRLFQYVSYDGVKFPNIVDYYRDGIQESRVNYQSVKLDAPVGEEIFVKPAGVKAIK